MAVLKPTITMDEPLILERSFGFEMNEMEAMEKSFIKYEKCRDDLLELIDNGGDERRFIIGNFNDVESMATQILDTVRLTLASNINSDNKSVNINDDMLQEILKIIEYDAKLDVDNEIRKNKGLIGFPNRPRNWKRFCMTMLIDPVKNGMQASLANQLGKDLLDIAANNSNVKELRIEHDMAAYREELLTMKKYFQEALLCKANFCKILKNFLETEDIFEQANNHIANSNLLVAIEKIFKAESIRYHLLAFAESYKEFDAINELLIPYYESIEQNYAKFIDEAKYYCIRGIDIMRGKNSEAKKQLEVILRAVEIDKKIDQLYENNKFKIANRPHCWSKILFKIIEECVQQRVEAFQIEDRELNQNWVIRNLEICRSYIVNDLYAAKHFLRIFPKEHQLYNNFILFYHNGIANKISELAKGELNKRELIQLLSWIRQYPGEHMLGMAYLEIDVISLIKDKPLIKRNELIRLFDKLVEIIKPETAKWALKAVTQEFANTEELSSNILEDEFGYYYTHLPHILYSVINDQMNLACEISDEIVPYVLNECLNEYIRLICPRLKDSIIELKNKEIYAKECSEEHTKIMNNLYHHHYYHHHHHHHHHHYNVKMTIANNLDMLTDSTGKLEKYINVMGAIHGAIGTFKDIPQTLANITSLSSENILDKLNGNSKNQLNHENEDEIKLEDEEPTEGAWERIEILREQYNDMLRMVCDVHVEVLRYIELKIVAEYLDIIASRKLTCTEYQKRCAIAKCLQNNIEALNATFNPLFAQFNYKVGENLRNVLYSIAEFITLRDKGMLLLEIASLLRKYPEMTQEFLFALTDIRDDVTSSESRALTEDCMKMIGRKEIDPTLRQLFEMAKGERKTAQVIKDVVPRLRRRVKVSIANQ
ncbi:Exocyst complex component 3 [Dirofilaria immitis]|nr:Exocyst complex component 3 [Dirofilaria immitis]